MADPFDEISATIPGLVVRGVGAERASAEEQQPNTTGRMLSGNGSSFAGGVTRTGARVIRNA